MAKIFLYIIVIIRLVDFYQSGDLDAFSVSWAYTVFTMLNVGDPESVWTHDEGGRDFKSHELCTVLCFTQR